MFVIIHNNNVILGPMPWRKLFFENTILDDCEVKVQLPQKYEGVYPINDEIVIKPARYTYDDIDTVTQKHNGPFWTFTDTEAVGHFISIDKDLEHVKSELKQLVADKRWTKEVSGIKFEIDGKEYSIITSREGRSVYATSLQMCAESYEWKFNEGYATLTPTVLQNIVQAINQHIQNCFAEEKARHIDIESKTTLSELKDLHDVYNPVVEPNGLPR